MFNNLSPSQVMGPRMGTPRQPNLSIFAKMQKLDLQDSAATQEYSDTESNLRDLPKKGKEKVLKSDVQLKEGSPLFVEYPLNDSPKLAKNIAAKSTKIRRHNKHE